MSLSVVATRDPDGFVGLTVLTGREELCSLVPRKKLNWRAIAEAISAGNSFIHIEYMNDSYYDIRVTRDYVTFEFSTDYKEGNEDNVASRFSMRLPSKICLEAICDASAMSPH